MTKTIDITVRHLNITYEKVNSLVGEFVFQYTDDGEPKVRFSNEYLRKIKDLENSNRG